MSSETIRVPFINLAQQHAPLKTELLAACEKVLDHGMFILGPEVEAFERRFADYCGTRFAVGIDSGTNALLLSLKALGIGPGDEVITAANSFLASASVIALAGATPVLVDIADDMTIDPACVEQAITPRTRGIIPVHLTGRPAQIDSIMALADRHNVAVVEDAAQAVGAMYHGKKVGSFGATGCFSLHPLKVLGGIGDGGVITTNDERLYGQLLKARNHGLKDRDTCEFWSYNARLDTIQAAFQLVKMNYLEDWIAQRREIAQYYRSHLAGTVVVPDEPVDYRSVYQTFIVRCQRRDELQAYLQERGIDTKVHYLVSIHRQPAAAGLPSSDKNFERTDRFAGEILSLPIYPELTPTQANHVINAIIGFYAGNP